eukprot:scaffold114687_cov60-Phaeocystis_antarctica.AAC.1
MRGLLGRRGPVVRARPSRTLHRPHDASAAPQPHRGPHDARTAWQQESSARLPRDGRHTAAAQEAASRRRLGRSRRQRDGPGGGE